MARGDACPPPRRPPWPRSTAPRGNQGRRGQIKWRGRGNFIPLPLHFLLKQPKMSNAITSPSVPPLDRVPLRSARAEHHVDLAVLSGAVPHRCLEASLTAHTPHLRGARRGRAIRTWHCWPAIHGAQWRCGGVGHRSPPWLKGTERTEALAMAPRLGYRRGEVRGRGGRGSVKGEFLRVRSGVRRSACPGKRYAASANSSGSLQGEEGEEGGNPCTWHACCPQTSRPTFSVRHVGFPT